MADASRWLGGRYHPAFLSCLMIVVSVVILLQHTCNTSSPAYLVTPPAHAVLSKLTRHHPRTLPLKQSEDSKPRLQISARINRSSLPAAVVPTEATIAAASTGDVVEEVESPAADHSSTAEPEEEGLTTTVDPEGLNQTDGEFGGEEFVAVTGSRGGETESARSLDISRDDVNGKGSKVAESEKLGVGLQLGDRSSENLEEKTMPDQVQSKEIESQERNEEPRSTRTQPLPKEPRPNPIFHELQACKETINEASPEVADPTLHKPLYKNVAAFSKSYELMEKVFKVYTYKNGRKPLVHTGPLVGIYASEGQFIERMKRASDFRTEDPSAAHMFFLPYSVQHMVAHLYVPNSHTMLPLATFIKEYVEELARKHPFWNRTQGADHFFVSCHDWGPATARDHPTLRSNAMKVVCNADTTEEFVLGKDASLPEVYIHKLRSKAKSKPEKFGGPRPEQRPYLAFFAGQMHGRVRPSLLSRWKDKDPDMKIYEVLPKQIARTVSYTQHMKLSKYCICAMGYEVNSPRIVEAIYNDCVPVIIADNFVLPFSEVLDWEAFSVTVPEKDMPRLKSILMEIPEMRYREMQGRLKRVRQHFVWHEVPEKYDSFHMILHSVWSSRINRLEQIRETSTGEMF